MSLTWKGLDHEGFAEILKDAELAALVYEVAEEIATNVESAVDANDGVVVESFVTDRVAASVTIRDPRALDWQVRDGVLTRAAAAAGLEVKAR